VVVCSIIVALEGLVRYPIYRIRTKGYLLKLLIGGLVI